jgi:hypothetical protein
MTILHQNRQRKLTISMPGFVDRLLRDLNIVKGAHDPRSPIAYVSSTYATGPQLEHEDNSPLLDPAGKTFIQRVVGKCLFFGRIISPLIEDRLRSIPSYTSRTQGRPVPMSVSRSPSRPLHHIPPVEHASSDPH